MDSLNNKSNIETMDFTLINNEMDLDLYLLFVNAIRSPLTRQKYFGRLNSFFDYVSIPRNSLDERCKNFIKLCNENPKYPLNCVNRFVIHLKEKMEKGEIVVSTIYNYLKPIKLLCEINEINVKWKKITIGLPKERKYAEDRAPTIEDIQKLIECPDRRLKAIVSTMVSSGMRLAAWDDLKYKHIEPIEEEGSVVAAKIVIYPGSNEQYFSFITPEAYNALMEWRIFRQTKGEVVSDESWILRNLWDVTTPSGGPRGLVSIPKKLKHTGVKSLVERALRSQGLRTRLEEGKKRYPFQTDHGFRKFFKTRCEMAGMKSINIEILMNHSTGVSDSYYRPLEREILHDYLKAVDLLTINNNDEKILHEINQIRQRNENNESLLQSKPVARDEQIIRLVQKHQEDIEKIQKETESKLENKFKQLISKLDLEKIISI